MLTLVPFSTSDLLPARQRKAPWNDLGVPAPEAKLPGADGMTGSDVARPSIRSST